MLSEKIESGLVAFYDIQSEKERICSLNLEPTMCPGAGAQLRNIYDRFMHSDSLCTPYVMYLCLALKEQQMAQKAARQ